MDESIKSRLSQISTVWEELDQAHGCDDQQAMLARRLLVERYGPAIRSYLGALTSTTDQADELLQEFVLRLVRGDFKNASADRGRFRSYLKTILIRMVWAFQKKSIRSEESLDLMALDIDQDWQTEMETKLDAQFVATWKKTLIDRAWNGLQEIDRRLYFTLRLRSENENLNSSELAERLSEEFDQTITAANARKLIHRGRLEFAEQLMSEVARSVSPNTPQQIEDELVELGLMEYCREAFEQFGGQSASTDP